MTRDIKELAKYITKEDFLEQTEKQFLCPHQFDLTYIEDCKEAEEGLEECRMCWLKALKSIEFAKSTDKVLSELYPLLDSLRLNMLTIEQLQHKQDDLKGKILKVMQKYHIRQWVNDKVEVSTSILYPYIQFYLK